MFLKPMLFLPAVLLMGCSVQADPPALKAGHHAVSVAAKAEPVWDSFLTGPARRMDDGRYMACDDARSQLAPGPLGQDTCTIERGDTTATRYVRATPMTPEQVTLAWMGEGYMAIAIRPLFSGHGKVRDDQVILYVKAKT